ncbi:type II toxin-antitoxin system VapC family toxin [Nonlabens ponticola]|uniref:PIN domain-containing protein n=1 Tax=Nonlabens ponticola TaxID=2496866 RepID=A0A3S9MXR8_9FLAO|nr:PIN domain-containing protein [Nonlabens ponticola]AZQ43990.1 PIN domain-containing protein [Nonlabens ponticola]
MKRLLVDTNIVIDLLAQREPFYKDAALLFSKADRQEVSLFISSLSFANTNYILSKSMAARDARSILRKFKIIVGVLSLDEKIIELALNDNNFKDFEDGLQYYTAVENQLDIIITRNKKDFKSTNLPIMNAGEYLASGKV